MNKLASWQYTLLGAVVLFIVIGVLIIGCQLVYAIYLIISHGFTPITLTALVLLICYIVGRIVDTLDI